MVLLMETNKVIETSNPTNKDIIIREVTINHKEVEIGTTKNKTIEAIQEEIEVIRTTTSLNSLGITTQTLVEEATEDISRIATDTTTTNKANIMAMTPSNSKEEAIKGNKTEDHININKEIREGLDSIIVGNKVKVNLNILLIWRTNILLNRILLNTRTIPRK